ncbi:MAG TPA: acyl transferase [Panacibacter sp.]|nr:acyl transferase [Panacibacter sp.]
MQQPAIVNNIFSETKTFAEKVLHTMHYQYTHNKVYREWNDILNIDIASVNALKNIPFLPISFFKTHIVTCGQFKAEDIFESSGTTQTATSRHYIKHTEIYRESFKKSFALFYGDIKEWCIIGLLPSYLERGNSSLILMVDSLIKKSNHTQSGFYLNDFYQLKKVLTELEIKGQKTLLIGVTFALLDFAEEYSMTLKNTIIMETGGMKGRRKELTRPEVHSLLCKNFGSSSIHSEYGMTELLSQAYSKGGGRFYCPPWMKVMVRDEEDPFSVHQKGRGVLNIIDLANLYSCSFIATEDAGTVYEDGSFEVHGRIDNSDARGCSLMFL